MVADSKNVATATGKIKIKKLGSYLPVSGSIIE